MSWFLEPFFLHEAQQLKRQAITPYNLLSRLSGSLSLSLPTYAFNALCFDAGKLRDSGFPSSKFYEILSTTLFWLTMQQW
jgi:hypothetical protein